VFNKQVLLRQILGALCQGYLVLRQTADIAGNCNQQPLQHMNTQQQIAAYIASLPEAKQADMQQLHEMILKLSPGCKLWFLDGKNDEGKVVSNPNIGYGSYMMQYAKGDAKEFYRVGLSGNTTGISVYIMGLDDKTHLANTYGSRLGKATITGYCIKFKKLKDIDVQVLEEAVRERMEM
jgi:hypothetical protein